MSESLEELERRLAEGRITPLVLQKIAAKVVQFHERAEFRPEIASFGRVEIIRTNVEENFTQMEKYVGLSLSAEAFQGIRDHTRNFIEAHLSLFADRLTEGRIRDGHGDLPGC